jgi:hypothetical protein
MKARVLLICSIVAAAGLAAGSEIVVLKGGKSMELAKPYMVKGNQAVMTLIDGTVVSIPVADVDKNATAAARAKAAAPEAAPVGARPAMTPVEAARAQQQAPKAKVKLSDNDVQHGGYQEGTSEEAAAGGDAAIDVVNWDQSEQEGMVTVKGTLKNSGKAQAENIGMSVTGRDDAGKTVATASADIAAATLEPGATASFTASFASAVRIASVKFSPRWSGPVKKGVVSQAAGPSKPPEVGAAEKKPGTAAAAGAQPLNLPSPAQGSAEGQQSTYKPSPDYAAPAPSSQMSSPDDWNTGYIPGAHEENPPPLD